MSIRNNVNAPVMLNTKPNSAGPLIGNRTTNEIAEQRAGPFATLGASQVDMCEVIDEMQPSKSGLDIMTSPELE